MGKFWRINGSKIFGEEKFGKSVGSILKILAFINIGGENFGELPTVHQIRQNFPTYGIWKNLHKVFKYKYTFQNLKYKYKHSKIVVKYS